ncbi:hypothetical protein GF348_16985 [candidate division KSB3 bacterium]|nr:hypothetical protein [candidate division KSB3 bacterium]
MPNSHKTYTSIPEFLELAIQFEVDSAHFYEALQQKVSNPQAQDVLEMLAKEEVQHQQTLQAYEVKDKSGFLQFAPSLTALMPPVPEELPGVDECLTLALAREQKSVEIYENTAGMTTGDFREILLGLANFERQHIEKVTMLKRSFGKES